MQLQRLNMDNSWLVDFGGTRLLVDPWLGGEQIDGARWFSVQRHLSAPLPLERLAPYDFVIVTQPYSDHFHKETLLALKPAALIAPEALRKAILRILPETHFIALNAKSATHAASIRLTLLPHDQALGPNFHALGIDDGHESMIFAPHGLPKLEGLGHLPPCKLLMTTFNTYRLPRILGGTIAPGTEQLARLIEALKPDFVLRTHDEIKEAHGLVSRLAKVSTPSDEEALQLPCLQGRYLPVNDYHPFTLGA